MDAREEQGRYRSARVTTEGTRLISPSLPRHPPHFSVSMGVGVKLGLGPRAEYATDGNQANGTTFVRFGERF